MFTHTPEQFVAQLLKYERLKAERLHRYLDDKPNKKSLDEDIEFARMLLLAMFRENYDAAQNHVNP